MPRYTATVPSAKSPVDLFDYMADFASAAEWDPSVVRAERLGDGPPRLGSRFLIVVRLFGRDSPFEYEIVEHDAPRKVVVRAEDGSVLSLDTMTVEPVGEGSALIYDAQLNLKGARRLFSPVMSLVFKRLGDDAKAGLERELARR